MGSFIEDNGPADFVDAEVIKAKLEALTEVIEEMNGRLEAIQASLEMVPLKAHGKVKLVSGDTRFSGEQCMNIAPSSTEEDL